MTTKRKGRGKRKTNRSIKAGANRKLLGLYKYGLIRNARRDGFRIHERQHIKKMNLANEAAEKIREKKRREANVMQRNTISALQRGKLDKFGDALSTLNEYLLMPYERRTASGKKSRRRTRRRTRRRRKTKIKKKR